MAGPKTSARQIETVDRHVEALKLRAEGKKYPEIAETLGYANSSGAYKAVVGALKATLREPAEELRTLELDRLDTLLDSVWTMATTGDLGAVDRVLKIQERRSKLLGLDAPERVDIEQWVRELAAQNGVDPDEAAAIAQTIAKSRKDRR